MKNALLLVGLCASGGIVQGQVYTFSNATATGPTGPTQVQVDAAYASTTLANAVTVTGGIQSWTVPAGGAYKIEVYGANGYGVYGGKGAYMSGEFNFNTGDVLKVLVGQMGGCCNGSGTNQYGGGGGSFVVAATGNVPLIIAGGGGGGSTFYNNVNLATSHNTVADASITTTAKTAAGTTNGAGGTAGNGGAAGNTGGGGGGFSTDGTTAAIGGFAFVNGGAGGNGATGQGGFGGGAGISGQNNMRAGGGGGYSGGGGCGSSTTVPQIAGGGGSYNIGTNQVNTPGLGTGHGSVVITKLGPPCNAPTGLTATGITHNSANTSWGTVTGAIGYEYAVNTNSTPPATGTGTTGTSYSAPGLTPGTTYYLHVRTQCAASAFSSWATYSFTTPTCSAVTGLTSPTFNHNSAIFNWAAGTGIGYEYALTSSTTPPTSGTATTNTTYNATGLTPNTNYCLHVRTQCGVGVYSSWVNTCITTLAAPPCPGPDTLNVTNITTSTADLAWNAVAGSTGYEYAVTQSAAPPVSGTPTQNLTHSAGGLLYSTQYYAHVRSGCTGGLFSPWKTTPFNTPMPTCDPPTATVSNITNEDADISWAAMPFAQSYQVAVFSNPNPPNIAGIPTTATNYNATNLVSGKLYYVHLRTICSFDTSAWSTATFYTTVPASVNTIGASSVAVYPNPVSDILNVNLSNKPGRNAQITVTDALGKEISRVAVLTQQFTVDMGNLPVGIYLLRYQDEETISNIRVSKQ